MIRIAIVEDEKDAQERLISYISRYYDGDSQKFNIRVFDKCEPFIYGYKPEFDIIFMDIGLPGINGMDAAKQLRKLDPVAVIIFVTSLAQYAIKGYEVHAFDFVVKTVTYADFELKFRRAENAINSNGDIFITISDRSQITRISTRDIIYVEVQGHYLYFHTSAEVLKGYGTMANLEKLLSGKNFMRCNSCYLINAGYIKKVEGYTVYLKNGDEVSISRQKKKQFMTELTVWLGEGKNI